MYYNNKHVFFLNIYLNHEIENAGYIKKENINI